MAACVGGMSCPTGLEIRTGGRGGVGLPSSFPSSVPAGLEAVGYSLSDWLLTAPPPPPPPPPRPSPVPTRAESPSPTLETQLSGRDLGCRYCTEVRECVWTPTLCPLTTDSSLGKCHCHCPCSSFLNKETEKHRGKMTGFRPLREVGCSDQTAAPKLVFPPMDTTPRGSWEGRSSCVPAVSRAPAAGR